MKIKNDKKHAECVEFVRLSKEKSLLLKMEIMDIQEARIAGDKMEHQKELDQHDLFLKLKNNLNII